LIDDVAERAVFNDLRCDFQATSEAIDAADVRRLLGGFEGLAHSNFTTSKTIRANSKTSLPKTNMSSMISQRHFARTFKVAESCLGRSQPQTYTPDARNNIIWFTSIKLHRSTDITWRFL
jgi:hypothetical protein